MIQCPLCGNEVEELMPLSPEQDGQTAACESCVGGTKKSSETSSLGVLFAQEKARQQERINLWKSRLGLIKRANQFMTAKRFSDSAVAYEKYLRILEMSLEIPRGETIKPQDFKESGRTKELTIIASVYWDLVRIYDTHDRYTERMRTSARQLAKFVPFTPIFGEITRKAKTFQKKARNPDIIRQFLRDANAESSRCFIATAAFESPLAPEVMVLRRFRDDVLLKTSLGPRFVEIYYRLSPPFANFLNKSPQLKPAVRGLLRLLIKCVS